MELSKGKQENVIHVPWGLPGGRLVPAVVLPGKIVLPNPPVVKRNISRSVALQRNWKYAKIQERQATFLAARIAKLWEL